MNVNDAFPLISSIKKLLISCVAGVFFISLLSGCGTTLVKGNVTTSVDPSFSPRLDSRIVVLPKDLDSVYYLPMVKEALEIRGFRSIDISRSSNFLPQHYDFSVSLDVGRELIEKTKTVNEYGVVGTKMKPGDFKCKETNNPLTGKRTRCRSGETTIENIYGVTGEKEVTTEKLSRFIEIKMRRASDDSLVLNALGVSGESDYKCSNSGIYKFLILKTVTVLNFSKPINFDVFTEFPEGFNCEMAFEYERYKEINKTQINKQPLTNAESKKRTEAKANQKTTPPNKLHAEKKGNNREPEYSISDEGLSSLIASAEGGSDLSQFTLGEIYAEGLNVKKDLQEARHWYRRAAMRGNTGAQNNLARLYLQDTWTHVQAYIWFRASQNGGNATADKNLKSLDWDNGMSEKADALAVRCIKSQYKDCERYVSNQIALVDDSQEIPQYSDKLGAKISSSPLELRIGSSADSAGVLVSDITENGFAEAMGLKTGDIITCAFTGLFGKTKCFKGANDLLSYIDDGNLKKIKFFHIQRDRKLEVIK